MHREGKQMVHVDALSRFPVEPAKELESATLNVWKIEVGDTWMGAMQTQDDDVVRIKDILNREPRSNWEKQVYVDYCLENDRVYRKVNDKKLFYIPKRVRFQVVHNCHDARGHLGPEKTVNMLRRVCWFPRMKAFVDKYISSCPDCLYFKEKAGKKEGQLYPIPKTPIPFHTIHIDHLGSYPKTPRKNKYLVVIVDGYTKFTLLKAVKNTSTKPIINAIKEMASYVGVPSRIICDRGASFQSHNFKVFCNENDIELHHIATAVHRGNGQVERFNRTINQMLSTLCSGDDSNWDNHIKKIQWSLNSMESATTKETPQKLMLGFQPRPITEDKIALALHDFELMDESQRQELVDQVGERIECNQQKQKQRFDFSRKAAHEYQVGDYVMIQMEAPSTGESRKLNAKYNGPYRVVQKLYGDRYVVEGESSEGRRRYKGVHVVERMKLCLPPPDVSDEEKENYSSDNDYSD